MRYFCTGHAWTFQMWSIFSKEWPWKMEITLFYASDLYNTIVILLFRCRFFSFLGAWPSHPCSVCISPCNILRVSEHSESATRIWATYNIVRLKAAASSEATSLLVNQITAQFSHRNHDRLRLLVRTITSRSPLHFLKIRRGPTQSIGQHWQTRRTTVSLTAAVDQVSISFAWKFGLAEFW